MKKTELNKEGRVIAERLGNGLKYLGPQIIGDEFYGYLFNDDLTRNTFGGKTFEEIKEKLIKIRELSKAKPPIFGETKSS